MNQWLRTTAAAAILLFAVGSDAQDPTPTSPDPDGLEMLSNAPANSFFVKILQSEGLALSRCCKVCSAGKACGNTCIAEWMTCHVGPGCACDG